MVDLNKLPPPALKAAMEGGTAGWGRMGSAAENVRYKVALPKIKARRRCSCGCGGKATHVGMANGVGLTRGCELSMQRWLKTGDKRSMKTYVLTHTTADGKVTTLEASLGGDADARYWGKLVVARDGGAVSIPLQDGTTFT